MKEKGSKLFQGDCLEVLKTFEDNSVDSITTDPPYGICFLGKKWDYDVPKVEIWQEALRVLKPGGHALVACGTRTQHRMAVNLEDAGFEIRDIVAWIYGSGFPKSLNIGKKVEGWEGWGTSLKPSMEMWTLCRKPLSEKTVSDNVVKHSTGAINIDRCRVGDEKILAHHAPKGTFAGGEPDRGSDTNYYYNIGRFPSNLIHDGSPEVIELFPNNARRFFYCAKPSKEERTIGAGKYNTHPTVKPVALMRYLCRLITPPNGTVLDPFMGSGSTGIACKEEGFNFIGIEKEEEYLKISQARMQHKQQSLLRGTYATLNR